LNLRGKIEKLSPGKDNKRFDTVHRRGGNASPIIHSKREKERLKLIGADGLGSSEEGNKIVHH